MNKLFTKIAALALGATMAVGVGVAVASGTKEASSVSADSSITGYDPVSSIATGDVVYFTYVAGGTPQVLTSVTSGTKGDVTAISNKTMNTTYPLTVGKSGDYWTFKDKNNKYLAFTSTSTSSNNKLWLVDSATANGATWTVSFSGTTATIKNVYNTSRTLRGNTTSGQYRICGYTGSTGNLLTLYAEASAGDYVGSLSVSPSTWTGYDSQTLSVSSFTVSGSKNGTAGAVTSSDYEYKGIGYMSGDNFVARDADFSSGNPTTADTRLAWKAKYPTTSGGSTYAWAYVTLTVSADGVNSIAISGSMTKTTYNQGDAWDPTGFTVKAYYASAPSTPVDVTNNSNLSWSYSPATTASTSTTSVTCTASFGGKSATSSAQSVTVNEKQNLGGLTEGRFFLIVGGHVLKASTFAAKGADTYTTADDSVDGLSESDAWYFAPTGSDDTWTIRVSDADNANYLYATNTNNGLVSGGTSDSWTVEEGTGETYTGKLLMKDTTNSRYISYTTSASSYIRVYGNTNNGDCAVSFVPYEEPVTLDSLTISGTYPTTFTKGDTFSHAGMVVTANYSDSTSATVTSSATWSSPDMSTPGAKTVTVSYSDEYGSASKTYSITVNYANPTGITLSLNSKKLALLEEFDVADVDVTINPSATADQSEYEWIVYDSDGLVKDDTYVFSGGVFYAMEPADAVVLRCQSTKSGYAATVYADVTVEITGDPIVTLFNASDADKTNGSESVFTDVGDITYHVTTENFSGTLTYTWNSSDTSVISIDSDNGSSCDFYVEGDEGSSRLSCRVQDTASHDVTVYIDVTVEAWSVTAVNWTAPTIDVFSGATLTSSDVSSWNVKYDTDSGKTNQTASLASIVVKLAGSTISLPHTWVAADNGKALGVEYGGVLSSTTTVAVTQSINAVMASSTSSWDYTFPSKQWSAAGSVTLDEKSWTMSGTDDGSPYFGWDNTKGQQFGSGTHPFSDVSLQSSDFSGTVDSVTVYTSGANSINATVQVSVGGTAYGSAQTITNANAAYTFDLGGKSGTISIDWVNSSSKAIYVKEIVVNTVSGSTNIANVAAHKAAQRVAVAFANTFNAAMDETEGCTTGLDDAWSACSSAYTAFLNAAAALGETEEAYAKNLIKYATAQYSDDSGEACIERMMKTYEICVNKHGKTAFMSDLVTLGALPVSPIQLAVNSNNAKTIAIVVIISAITAVAIGGYFFLRKKED